MSTSRETCRRPTSSRAVDPFFGAVGEALVLPDRDLGLDAVDQGVGRRHRLCAVLGCYGHEQIRTPNLDRFARDKDLPLLSLPISLVSEPFNAPAEGYQ